MTDNRLPKEELDVLRELLVEKKQWLLAEISRNLDGASTSSENRSSDVMDQATEAFDDEMAVTLANQEVESLRSIDQALAQIEEGSYGVCGGCEKPINFERLKAIPFATLCIECARKREGKK